MPTLQTILDQKFRQAIHAALGFDADPLVAPAQNEKFGDYQANAAMSLAKAVQDRAIETAQYGWIGQWYGPGAARKNIQGWLKAPVPVMWNVTKT